MKENPLYLNSLKRKFKKKKEVEKKEEIPPGYVKCTRCGKIVPQEKATVSLPESWWVCDKCYFGEAK